MVENRVKESTKECEHNQLVLLFEGQVSQGWGSWQQVLRLPPCGLFLERKGILDGIGTWINNFFSVCHNIARTWTAAYWGNGRNVGDKVWNRESSPSNSNHHPRAASFRAAPQLSRPEGKTEASTGNVLSSHTQPCVQWELGAGTVEEGYGKVQKWGISKA